MDLVSSQSATVSKVYFALDHALCGLSSVAKCITSGKYIIIKIGYVSPQTGPLASFAESDAFNIQAFLATEAGANFEVIVKDSQSNPNRAAEVAKELISRDEVNLILVASTPETTNPVCSIAEQEEIPVISTVAPWQPWFIGQQGNPGDPASWQEFDYVYHFFWGLEDNIATFMNMWAMADTNKKVGALWPNDGDGNAWASPEVGMPPALAAGALGERRLRHRPGRAAAGVPSPRPGPRRPVRRRPGGHPGDADHGPVGPTDTAARGVIRECLFNPVECVRWNGT